MSVLISHMSILCVTVTRRGMRATKREEGTHASDLVSKSESMRSDARETINFCQQKTIRSNHCQLLSFNNPRNDADDE